MGMAGAAEKAFPMFQPGADVHQRDLPQGSSGHGESSGPDAEPDIAWHAIDVSHVQQISPFCAV
jgi:hypothetical protein